MARLIELNKVLNVHIRNDLLHYNHQRLSPIFPIRAGELSLEADYNLDHNILHASYT